MMRNIGTQYLPVIAGFRSSPSTTLYRGLGDGPDGGVNAFGQSTARRAADLACSVKRDHRLRQVENRSMAECE